MNRNVTKCTFGHSDITSRKLHKNENNHEIYICMNADSDKLLVMMICFYLNKKFWPMPKQFLANASNFVRTSNMQKCIMRLGRNFSGQ